MQILNQQRSTIVISVHILVISIMLVAAFFPQVFVEAKTSGAYYVPFSANTSDWGSQVCKMMTVGGCAYFTSSELDAAWVYLDSVDAAGVEMELVEFVINLGNEQDLWKAEFVISHSDGGVETHQAYVVMTNRFLDRVVSLDQILIVGGLPWN